VRQIKPTQLAFRRTINVYTLVILLTTSACMLVRPGYVPIYQMSYMWYAPFAVLVTSVTGLLVSFLTGSLIIYHLYPVYTMKLARRAGSTFAWCLLRVGYALCMLHICLMFARRLLDVCSMFARCLLDRVNGVLHTAFSYIPFTRSSNHQANVQQTSSQLVEPASSCKRGITRMFTG